jgi:glycosyltransferase involved in cell wall biosynthesis
MAAYLTRRGHRVSVVCLSDEVAGEEMPRDFSVVRIRRAMFKPWRMIRVIAAIMALARRADLIYVNGLGMESALASFLSGVPTVHKVVGDYAWERARNRGWFSGTIEMYQVGGKGPLLRFLDWMRTLPLRQASAIIVPSDYLRRLVIGWGIRERRTGVIYNAPDPAEEMAGEPVMGPDLPTECAVVLVTVCRLVNWKGVDGLIRVIAQMPGVALAVVGDGPERSRLAALALESGVASRVRFFGNRPAEQVKDILRVADIFVLNSNYEGLPHVVLEAMSAGLPVVATDVGGTHEVVEHRVSGMLVPAGNDAALKGAISEIIDDRALADSLVSGGHRRLSGIFSADFMFRATESVLENLDFHCGIQARNRISATGCPE